jgi:hypothetical protein
VFKSLATEYESKRRHKEKTLNSFGCQIEKDIYSKKCFQLAEINELILKERRKFDISNPRPSF